MKTCKQQSEIEMRPRLALDRFKRYGRWICKQQSEIEMRHLHVLSIYGYVGGRQT